MMDKPIARKLEFIFTPIITVYVEEFEDGTFDVKTYSDICWSNSFSNIYDEEAQDDVDYEVANEHPAWEAVDSYLGTLALKQHYAAWTPEDEPF